MITIKLMGGVGNQLWQWGLGQTLGIYQEVRYDRSLCDANRARPYSLDKLGIQVQFGTPRGRLVSENGFKFDPQILNIEGDATLVGYWQNEKYIESAKNRILANIFLDMKLSDKAQSLLSDIQTIGPNSAFIHVRRGDYLKEPHASYHGNLNRDYYQLAEACLRLIDPDIKFFIFSDDPTWCKTAFPSGTVVEGTNESDDLYLMSQCRNAIIANSSFSFWGAYLGADQRSGSIVAPKLWFKDPTADGSEIVPSRWLKI